MIIHLSLGSLLLSISYIIGDFFHGFNDSLRPTSDVDAVAYTDMGIYDHC